MEHGRRQRRRPQRSSRSRRPEWRDAPAVAESRLPPGIRAARWTAAYRPRGCRRRRGNRAGRDRRPSTIDRRATQMLNRALLEDEHVQLDGAQQQAQRAQQRALDPEQRLGFGRPIDQDRLRRDSPAETPASRRRSAQRCSAWLTISIGTMLGIAAPVDALQRDVRQRRPGAMLDVEELRVEPVDPAGATAPIRSLRNQNGANPGAGCGITPLSNAVAGVIVGVMASEVTLRCRCCNLDPVSRESSRTRAASPALPCGSARSRSATRHAWRPRSGPNRPGSRW